MSRFEKEKIVLRTNGAIFPATDFGTMSQFKGLPYRRQPSDLETGGSNRSGDDEESSSSPFNIPRTKNVSIERLRRWRAAYLFKAAGEQQMNGAATPPSTTSGDFPIGQERLASMTRDHNLTTLQQYGGPSFKPEHIPFPTLLYLVVCLLTSAMFSHLVKGIGDLLKTNLDKGVSGDDDDLLKRRNVFGSNTYPKKRGRSFWLKHVIIINI